MVSWSLPPLIYPCCLTSFARGEKIIKHNPVQFRTSLVVIALILIDLFAVKISMLIAYTIRNHLLVLLFPAYFSSKLLAQTLELFWWYPLAFIVSIAYERLYHKRLPFWIEVQWLMKAGIITLFLTIALLYMVQIGDEVSRTLVLLTWLCSMLALPFFRYYGKKSLLKINIYSRPVIIIGNEKTIPLIKGAFEREATMGYKVIGCIINPEKNSGSVIENPKPPPAREETPCLGHISEAVDIVKSSPVEDLVIFDTGLSSEEQVEMTNRLQPLVKYITLVPDLFGVSLSGIEAAYFFEEQIVMLQIRNRLRSKINSAVKRAFDLLFSALLFLISAPAMLLISAIIKFDSPGPVFYQAKRIGRNGTEFNCLKFRTMKVNCDQILESYLASNQRGRLEWELYNKLITSDPRVTRPGRFLRSLSLDELPQVFNILKGEMSLIGPRPYLPREKEQMGDYANNILVGKPGLTGLWQVSGRNNLTFESRLKLDSWYIKNWSLWLDMILLVRTLRVVLKRDGAF